MENCARCDPIDTNQLCAGCLPLLQKRIDAILEEELPHQEGYDSALFVDQVPNYFECSLCMGAFRDPIHIVDCGHVFCKSCLNRATAEERMCPNHRGTPFTLTFPDQAKRREVLSLKVKCRKEDCIWNGDLSDLHDHLKKNCLKIQLSCLNEECLEVLLREDLYEHLNNNCFFRLIKCDFCNRFLNFNKKKEHTRLFCERFPVTCDFVCGKFFPRNEIAEHSLVCEKRPLKCSFAEFGCPFQGEKTLLSEHLKSDVSVHLQRTTETIKKLQKNYDDQRTFIQDLKINNDDILEKHKELLTRHDDIVNKHTKLSTKYETLVTKHEDLSTKHKDLSTKHEDLSTKHNDLSTKHNDLSTRHDVLQTKHEETQTIIKQIQKELNKKKQTFYWRIFSYEHNFEKAKNNTQEFIESPYFYTHKNYKFRLRAYLNGIGNSRNTHTSLYFRLCIGEHDDQLKWPFNKNVTLAILSQDADTNDKSFLLIAPDLKKYFEKPNRNKDQTIGFGDLLPHTGKHKFIKDDTMIVKCVVE